MATWFPPNEPLSAFLRLKVSQAKIRAELARLQEAVAKIEQTMLYHHAFQPTVHAQTANYTTDIIPTKTTHGKQGTTSNTTTLLATSTNTTVLDSSDHATACNAAVSSINECDTTTFTSTGLLIQSTLLPTLSVAPRLRFTLDSELLAISTLLSGINPHSRSSGSLAFPASTIHPLPRPPPEPDPTK